MRSPGALQRLLPVLVRVQARLDDDLSLDTLARVAAALSRTYLFTRSGT